MNEFLYMILMDFSSRKPLSRTLFDSFVIFVIFLVSEAKKKSTELINLTPKRDGKFAQWNVHLILAKTPCVTARFNRIFRSRKASIAIINDPLYFSRKFNKKK